MPDSNHFTEESVATSNVLVKENPTSPTRSRRVLDFIVIGSGKCGTTSLHCYLESHPALYLLPEKEVPYFTNEEYLARGWDWYASEFFSQAPAGKLWGKTTPHYMDRPDTPERIFQEMPRVKLIALLRNPIERAYSNYKMMVKYGTEHRPFPAVLDEKLRVGTFEDESYIHMGEYGRILGEYLRVFPQEQLLTLFTENLKANPAAALKQVLRFLEVDENFSPRNLGKQYHVGGVRRRIPVDEHALAKNRWFRRALKLVPRRSRAMFHRRFLFWFTIWNTRPDPSDRRMPPEARKRLAQFYREDVGRLEQLLDQPVPWPDFAGA